MQFVKVTVVAPPNDDAMAKVAYATVPLAIAFPLVPVVASRTSPLATALAEMPPPAAISSAPAAAETNVNCVTSKVRSTWNEAGATMPEKAMLTGTWKFVPGAPLPPAVDNMTVDGMFPAGIFTIIASPVP
jgi:hypothetical protein